MTKRIDVKTNATRILQQRRVPHEAFTYDESIKTADGAAGAMGVAVNRVFKTLVLVRSEGRPALLMVPGDKGVDMRALAREIGCKDVGLAPRTDAERLTGLQTGGIGALALLNKPFDMLLDEAALELDSIFVNGGRRGLNIRLRASDLVEVTGARVIPVVAGRS